MIHPEHDSASGGTNENSDVPPFSRGYEAFAGRAAEYSSQSTPAWPRGKKAAEGAPNVIVVLVDDLGFSDISPFGSEIDTPHLAQLAEEGLVLNNYHSAPVCSPARAALMTGQNPHRAGFGLVAHVDPGYPGYRMELDEKTPTMAETLRDAGYSTFMVGKWHLSAENNMHDAADRSSWPTQRGFDRYFGSLDGFTTLFHPHRLIQDNSSFPVETLGEQYLTDTLTDRAIGMVRDLRSNAADKPFFLYFAHQAVHGPVQAKVEDIAKYRDRYAGGWDRLRAERFARQVKSGLFPSGTILPESTIADTLGVPAWKDLDEETQAVAARHMAVYAASVDAVDQSLGRLRAFLKETGDLDNTIIVFTSDNGGTGEGGVEGTRSYFSRFIHLAGLPDDWEGDVPRNPDLMGGPQVHGHYPRGWAHVSNTPFRRYKGHCHAGGVRCPLVVSWPKGLKKAAGDAGIRGGYAYVTDLLPTILEMAGIERPGRFRGGEAPEIDGVSFLPHLMDENIPSTHDEQYTEIGGQRGLYRNGYKLISPLGVLGTVPEGAWELYDVANDPTESMDIAPQHPELVSELVAEWSRQAWRNTVFPIADDRSIFTDRPASIAALSEPLTIYPGAATVERVRASRLTMMRSFMVELRLKHKHGATGTILTHGDQGGGYALNADPDALVFAYNCYGLMHRVAGPELPSDSLEVQLHAVAGEGLTWEWIVCVDGTEWMRLGPVPQLLGMAPFTGITVGRETAGPVDWDRRQEQGPRGYTGRIDHATYFPGAITPENPERLIELVGVGEGLVE